MEIAIVNANRVDPDQTPYFRILRRLIWVYSVYQCPLYGTLGINGINFQKHDSFSLIAFEI